MDTNDYFEVAIGAMKKLDALRAQRETIDAEVVKLEQFVAATANLLSDEHKNLVLQKLELTQELSRVHERGLTDAVRVILRSTEEWLTTTNIRDRLLNMGFDFSDYSSNPLASVSTVLRRLPSDEVERKSVEGVTVCRWKETPMPSLKQLVEKSPILMATRKK